MQIHSGIVLPDFSDKAGVGRGVEDREGRMLLGREVPAG